MTSIERRHEHRMPLEIFLNEYVNDRPQRCKSVNLSENGLYLNRLNAFAVNHKIPQPKSQSVIGLEFELPDTSEVIWAAGSICFDQHDKYFHSTGIHFEGMATMHRRLVKDYIFDYREKKLQTLLKRVQQRKRRIIVVPKLPLFD